MPDIWRMYKDEPSDELRNFLIETFLHLVKYNAERIYKRLPDEVDLQDLMSAGLFGLMDAINAYDLERGVKFETYCAQRITGAILDELRSMDWVPRLVRHRTSKVEAAKQQIQMEFGRKATDKEVANRLEIDKNEFVKFKRDSSSVS
ncbi:MAG: sigma-70 family RNA polymerase sigma factor, partial [Phycisphaerales bacterium]|nr:sigma-70 family RNA polymerase sigma factor [Phycisphaerales bacterium]